jgi:hypothetical protein
MRTAAPAATNQPEYWTRTHGTHLVDQSSRYVRGGPASNSSIALMAAMSRAFGPCAPNRRLSRLLRQLRYFLKGPPRSRSSQNHLPLTQIRPRGQPRDFLKWFRDRVYRPDEPPRWRVQPCNRDIIDVNRRRGSAYPRLHHSYNQPLADALCVMPWRTDEREFFATNNCRARCSTPRPLSRGLPEEVRQEPKSDRAC